MSPADPCLFISSDVIAILCVDDCLLFCKDSTVCSSLTKRMKAMDVHCREEDNVAGFLGVHSNRREGEIHLTQIGLTERIISVLHLIDSQQTAVPTPVADFLTIDEDGDPPLGTFSCASIVGQLNCLSGHTRPDIAMATSEVARCLHKPKQSHKEALVWMGRHQKGTKEKRLILKPKPLETLNLDVFVDVAFASGWSTEPAIKPDSVKSQIGCIVESAGCPVLWVSKSQSTITTSTMQSECMALSMALRTFIPMCKAAKSVVKGLDCLEKQSVKFLATIHEDNLGAVLLANLEARRHTIRSEFHALKLHWFRHWKEAMGFEVVFIDTLKQKADFLTKAMPPASFEANQKLSMGWQSSIAKRENRDIESNESNPSSRRDFLQQQGHVHMFTNQSSSSFHLNNTHFSQCVTVIINIGDISLSSKLDASRLLGIHCRNSMNGSQG